MKTIASVLIGAAAVTSMPAGAWADNGGKSRVPLTSQEVERLTEAEVPEAAAFEGGHSISIWALLFFAAAIAGIVTFIVFAVAAFV